MNTEYVSTSLGVDQKTGKNYNVVIAEGIKTDALLLKQYLNAFEFKVKHELSDGQATIDSIKYAEPPIDIIFLSLNVLNKNPLEIIQEVRKINPKIIVIALALNVDKEVLANLSRLKINTLILKPFNKAQVLEKIATVLSRPDLLPKVITPVASEKKTKINLSELHIPPLPEVTEKIVFFDLDPVGGSEKLEQIILPDKGLCADILRIANSAFYGRSGKIQTLKDAITLLGLKTIKNISIVQTKKNISNNLTKISSFKKFLYEAPTLSSLIAFDLTTPLGLKNLKEHLFLPSSFRNSGMVILALNTTKIYQEIVETHIKTGKNIYEMEKEAYGVNSIDVGLEVFKAWNMPVKLFSVIKNQNFTVETLAEVTDIDRLTKIGEIISRKFYELPVTETEIELAKSIFQYYKVPEDTMDLFDEDYFDNIKSHPFLEVF